MYLSHGQVISKVYMSELDFYLSRAIGHRFWRTLINKVHYDLCENGEFTTPTIFARA